MKKTLVAVAALAAFSGAYAQVTISGLVDAAITVDGTTTSIGNGPNGGSEFTLSAKEDLGNGLSAIGAITLIAPAMGASIGTVAGVLPNENGVNTYNSFVGLSGGFGSVKLGSNWSPTFLASTISDATGRWGSSNLSNPGQLQNASSVTYTSPSMSGVTFMYQQQLGYDAAADGFAFLNTGVEASAYSLTYSADALTAAYASSTDAGVNTGLFAISYDFGMAKLHYGNRNVDGDTSNTLGVAVPFGALTLSAVFSSNADDTITNYQATYALSKRTMIYANSGPAVDAATQAVGANTTIIGVKHAF